MQRWISHVILFPSLSSAWFIFYFLKVQEVGNLKKNKKGWGFLRFESLCAFRTQLRNVWFVRQKEVRHWHSSPWKHDMGTTGVPFRFSLKSSIITSYISRCGFINMTFTCFHSKFPPSLEIFLISDVRLRRRDVEMRRSLKPRGLTSNIYFYHFGFYLPKKETLFHYHNVKKQCLHFLSLADKRRNGFKIASTSSITLT